MKHAWSLLLLALLAGCATVPERNGPERQLLEPVLLDMTARLPGDYSTVLTRSQRLDGEQPLLMSVETQPGSAPDRLEFLLTQLQRKRPPRLFLLSIQTGSEAHSPEGFFAPLEANGQLTGQCEMNFSVRQDGFSASTNPRNCRFGEGEQATGLLKEIAFDGSRLVIGDRLVRLATGEPVAADQVHAFSRIQNFSGWAGRREGEGWHRSVEFDIHSGDDQVELLDAAGMSLGIGVNLHRHDPGGDQPHILRLTVTEIDSGEVIAQSWADPDAEALGIALPDLQVGLQRID